MDNLLVSPPVSEPAPAASNTGTILQLLLSGFGFLVSLLAAAGLFLFGMRDAFTIPESDLVGRSLTVLFAMMWIALLVAALTLPLLVINARRLWGKDVFRPARANFRLASLLLIVWVAVLLIGYFVTRQTSMAWLLLPPLQLLAVGLPVWWWFEFARRGLPTGSRQRNWGVLNLGVLITMPLAMVAEILVILLASVLVGIWIGTQPELLQQFQQFSRQLSRVQTDPQAILALIVPYMQNPRVIYLILVFVAGVFPLLEELLKPLAMWALVNRRMSPAEGFVMGALCGAAFALIESLFYLSNPSDNWALLALGRSATGLVHITTSAMVGWGLASAWRNGAYLRLGGVFLLAVLLHGTWNMFSIITSLANLNPLPAQTGLVMVLAKAAPFGVAAVFVILVLCLWGWNRSLRAVRGQTVN